MKFIYFILCLLIPASSMAQGQKNIPLKVGDKLFINECPGNKPEFIGIEVYSRTDMYDKTNVDSLNGQGLSKAFFDTKSLDGKRLPCSMGGRAYTIAAIDKYTEKGVTHTIVLLYDYYPLNLLLLDYENAIFNKEISIPKAKGKK
jgi:hypothetical protein